MCVRIIVFRFYIFSRAFTQPLHYKQDVTPGQFMSRVRLFGIQFSFSKIRYLWKTKEHNLGENRWIYFRGYKMKRNQIHRGFELRVSIPFPTRITVVFNALALYFLVCIFAYENFSVHVDTIFFFFVLAKNSSFFISKRFMTSSLDS